MYSFEFVTACGKSLVRPKINGEINGDMLSKTYQQKAIYLRPTTDLLDSETISFKVGYYSVNKNCCVVLYCAKILTNV